MWQMATTPRGSLRCAIVAALVLASADSGDAQCQQATYEIARVLSESRDNIRVHIVAPIETLAPSRLVCLSEQLKTHFKKRTIEVWVFSSSAAARDDGAQLAFSDQLRAIYKYVEATREEFVDRKSV